MAFRYGSEADMRDRPLSARSSRSRDTLTESTSSARQRNGRERLTATAPHDNHTGGGQHQGQPNSASNRVADNFGAANTFRYDGGMHMVGSR